ncbi:hypothetical protein BD289DRAFT_438555 [Coniella lustricola]|uniref:Uncharacterized protein n=1 Tax=Coniella lustricola TaxID=2025994 RepID=A0A2T3A2V0_9PEZI|nr:hypothetical protein BD289DRAFT_438555 [Coniella lustricola]
MRAPRALYQVISACCARAIPCCLFYFFSFACQVLPEKNSCSSHSFHFHSCRSALHSPALRCRCRCRCVVLVLLRLQV